MNKTNYADPKWYKTHKFGKQLKHVRVAVQKFIEAHDAVQSRRVKAAAQRAVKIADQLTAAVAALDDAVLNALRGIDAAKKCSCKCDTKKPATKKCAGGCARKR